MSQFRTVVISYRARWTTGTTNGFEQHSLKKDLHQTACCISERMPVGSDAFDRLCLGESHIWPGWPADDMPQWVPEEIEDEFVYWCDPWNGWPYIHFMPEQVSEIIAAFEQYGFKCTDTEEDGLVELAFLG